MAKARARNPSKEKVKAKAENPLQLGKGSMLPFLVSDNTKEVRGPASDPASNPFALEPSADDVPLHPGLLNTDGDYDLPQRAAKRQETEAEDDQFTDLAEEPDTDKWRAKTPKRAAAPTIEPS